MHTRNLLPLILLVACGGGDSHTLPSDDGDPHLPPGLFDLGDAGVAGSSGSTGDASAGDATVDPLEPTDAEVTPDAEALYDAGVDAGADATVPTPDAGHDAGMPPSGGGTCDACVLDADCAAPYLCKLRSVDMVKSCFGPVIGMDYKCTTYAGSTWLYGPGVNTVCVPFDYAAFNYMSCAKWRMLTGL